MAGNVYNGPRLGLYPTAQADRRIRAAYAAYCVREHQANRRPDAMSRWIVGLVLMAIDAIEE